MEVTLFKVVMLFLIIALCLQVAGFASPGWVILYWGTFRSTSSHEIKINAGLWDTKAEQCVNGRCVGYRIDESALTGGYQKLVDGRTDYRVETCIALALLVISMVILALSTPTRCLPNREKIVWVTIICQMLSGILAIVPVARIGNDLRQLHDDLGRDSPLLRPYSLFLTGFGGVLAIIMALVLLLTVKPWRNDPPPRPAYGMSNMAESHGHSSAKYAADKPAQ